MFAHIAMRPCLTLLLCLRQVEIVVVFLLSSCVPVSRLCSFPRKFPQGFAAVLAELDAITNLTIWTIPKGDGSPANTLKSTAPSQKRAACQACCVYVWPNAGHGSHVSCVSAQALRNGRASKISGLRVVRMWNACARRRLHHRECMWNDMVRG